MRDRDGALFHPGLVAVRVVAVMMRVEGETNRLVRDRLDFRNDLLRA